MSHFIFTLRKVSLWFKRQSEFHFSKSRCCRKADPFQGPKPGSCLTLRDELSEETRVHQARDFIGKGTLVENSKVREPRRTALPRGSQGFMVMGGLSESFLVAHYRSAKMDASERDSGKWTDTRCLLSTFPELFRLVVAY